MWEVSFAMVDPKSGLLNCPAMCLKAWYQTSQSLPSKCCAHISKISSGKNNTLWILFWFTKTEKSWLLPNPGVNPDTLRQFIDILRNPLFLWWEMVVLEKQKLWGTCGRCRQHLHLKGLPFHGFVKCRDFNRRDWNLIRIWLLSVSFLTSKRKGLVQKWGNLW